MAFIMELQIQYINNFGIEKTSGVYIGKNAVVCIYNFNNRVIRDD